MPASGPRSHQRDRQWPWDATFTREFPKIRGTLFWAPYIKETIVYYIRVPYFRKLPQG